MDNIVTFETAQRLKEAGFPQPEPQAGQFWYYIRFPDGSAQKNVLCVLAHEYPYQDSLEAVPLDGGERIYNSRNTQVFAPTATDILHQMPGFSVLFLDNGNSTGWMVLNHAKEYIEFNEHNPAEAVAQAWLSLRF